MDVFYYFDLIFIDWLDLYNSSQVILGFIMLIDTILLLLIFIMFERKLTSNISPIVSVLVIINAPALYDSLGFMGVFIFMSGLVFAMYKLVSYLSFVVSNSGKVPLSENSVTKSVFFSLTGKKSTSQQSNEGYQQNYNKNVSQDYQTVNNRPKKFKRAARNEGDLDG